jgi:hypothetical protein
MSVRLDLNDFPDPAPHKWIANGCNRAQVTLLFIDIKALRLQGWSTDNRVDINLCRCPAGIAVTMTGQGTQIEGEFGFVDVEKISAYCYAGG